MIILFFTYFTQRFFAKESVPSLFKKTTLGSETNTIKPQLWFLDLCNKVKICICSKVCDWLTGFVSCLTDRQYINNHESRSSPNSSRIRCGSLRAPSGGSTNAWTYDKATHQCQHLFVNGTAGSEDCSTVFMKPSGEKLLA